MGDRQSTRYPFSQFDEHEHDWEYQSSEPILDYRGLSRWHLALGTGGPIIMDAGRQHVVEACLLCGQQRSRDVLAPIEVRLVHGVRRLVERAAEPGAGPDPRQRRPL